MRGLRHSIRRLRREIYRMFVLSSSKKVRLNCKDWRHFSSAGPMGPGMNLHDSNCYERVRNKEYKDIGLATWLPKGYKKRATNSDLAKI